MLDNIREWISDNLRYILLGLAGVLLLVIAFFAVRLISGLGSTKKKQETQQTTEAGSEQQAQTEALASDGETTLKKNDPEILGLIERYYSACLDKDYDTLASICEKFDDEAKADIEQMDVAVEEYKNYMTYSKPGLTEGSYIVYVYFEAKLTGIETLAPTLREKYVITDPEGHLVVAEPDSTEEISNYTKLHQADDDIQALMDDVNTAYRRALESDADLKAFVESPSDTQTQQGEDSGSDTDAQDSGATASTGAMQTTDVVNVRGEASAEATLYGTLQVGAQVEVLENLDSGWSKVRYTTNGTTIEGYVMTQYLTAIE